MGPNMIPANEMVWLTILLLAMLAYGFMRNRKSLEQGKISEETFVIRYRIYIMLGLVCIVCFVGFVVISQAS